MCLQVRRKCCRQPLVPLVGKIHAEPGCVHADSQEILIEGDNIKAGFRHGRCHSETLPYFRVFFIHFILFMSSGI